MRLWSLVVLAALCGGCTDEAALDLVVDGDLEPGTDADEIGVAIFRGGAQTWSETYPLSAADGLPLSYRIGRSSEGDRLVELRVTAYLGAKRQVEARRETTFVSGETVPVKICLWRRCLGSEEPGCLEGACEGPPADGDGDADAEVEVDAEVDGDGEADAEVELLCSDSCVFHGDGLCFDGGPGSDGTFCEFGTDCSDCGPRHPDECITQCHVRECGPDNCGGACPPGCDADEVCAYGGACVRWVEIHPDGPFLMGSPPDEEGRGGSIETQREVTLTRGFAISSREVSRSWFVSLVGLDTTSFPECGEDCPIESVSWPIAAAFCTYLSLGEGLPHCYECSGTTPTTFACELVPRYSSPYACEGYRLPTEAEWEYAARADTATATYAGDLDADHLHCESPNPTLDSIAWFCGNVPDEAPQPRGTLGANAFGLHDMLGNVFEFTHDWYETWDATPVVDPWGPPEGTDRTIRGGSFISEAWEIRAAGRGYLPATLRGLNVGFRCVRTLD